MTDTAIAHGSADGQGASEALQGDLTTRVTIDAVARLDGAVGDRLRQMSQGRLRELIPRAIAGKFRLHIPPQPDDDDLILSALIDEVAALRAEVAAQRPVVAAVERLELVWDALSACVAEFEPQDMTACAEQRDHLDTAILAALALARDAPGSAPDAEQEGLPARGTPAWDAEYQAACDARSWDMCELLQDQPWADAAVQQGA